MDRRKAESTDKVHIYRRWCKQCDICIEFCPKKALAADPDQYPELAYPDRCNQCGLCQLRCPDFAISVTPRPKKQNVRVDSTASSTNNNSGRGDGTASPDSRGPQEQSS